MTPEGKVKEVVKKILKSFGKDVSWYMTVPTGFGRAGIEDFTLCVSGQFVAIETKKNSLCKLTELQNARKEEVYAAGGYYLVVHADNLHMLTPILETIVSQRIATTKMYM